MPVLGKSREETELLQTGQLIHRFFRSINSILFIGSISTSSLFLLQPNTGGIPMTSYPTQNDLKSNAKAVSIDLLNAHLADAFAIARARPCLSLDLNQGWLNRFLR